MKGEIVHGSCDEMWAAFVGSDSPAAVSASDASYTAWQFGHGPEMADELLSVVLIGRKRATTGALRSYELEGEPLPRPGDFSVITDGRGIAGASSGPRRWTSARSTRSTPPTPVTKARARVLARGPLEVLLTRAGSAQRGNPELSMPVVCEHFEVVTRPRMWTRRSALPSRYWVTSFRFGSKFSWGTSPWQLMQKEPVWHTSQSRCTFTAARWVVRQSAVCDAGSRL